MSPPIPPPTSVSPTVQLVNVVHSPSTSLTAAKMAASPSTPSRATFAAAPAVAGHPTLIDFLLNVPAPLTAVLISLSSPIAKLRWLLEVVSWKRPYSESWLTLAAWWAVCFLSEFTLRYLFVLVAAAIYIYAANKKQSRRSIPLVTEESLQAVVVDLSVIESSLPSPDRPPPLSDWYTFIRVVGVLYIPSVILTVVVRLRVLIGIAGTIVLTWRAPWSRSLRTAVMRSAWVRWGLYQIWARITGKPYERKNIVFLSSTLAQPQHSIRFLFTIYENQRWWMGLDWTSALLPSERPSWCSATQEPLSPPSSFALPPATVVFTSDGHGGMLKRTATWAWEEGEWKVIVKKEDTGSRRVEKELTVHKEVTAPSQSKIDRTRQKLRDSKEKLSSTTHNGEERDTETFDEPYDGHVPNENEDDADEPLTDHDGWIYGDNQWKATSNKGGMGKYTRFRRWTRIAVLTEVVEPASAEEATVYANQQNVASKSSLPTPEQSPGADNQNGPSQENEKQERLSLQSGATNAADEGGDNEHSGLRSRLKAAVRKTTL